MAEIPSWLKSYLKSDELSLIEEGVKRAESRTSGEIVPMIVSRSSHVGHVPLFLVFLFLSIFLSIAVFLSRSHWLQIDDWILILGSIVAMGAGWFFSHFAVAKRLCIPKDDQWHQVDRRAELEFFEAGLMKTDGRTGILLFVSVLENRAVVLADRGISGKLPPETWHSVIKRLIDGIKQDNMAKGFIEAIDECGVILAQHFPIQSDDQNELKNRLRIKE